MGEILSIVNLVQILTTMAAMFAAMLANN